ncbi:MAG: formylglycine-generating enzyme family protein [Vicinamibacterales bacterium]
MNVELPDLVRIPSGVFLMGSDEGDDDERPAHRVRLDEFCIGAQPVTNAEYARFVRATGRRVPGLYELPLVVTAADGDREQLFRRTIDAYLWPNGEPPRERFDHPVTLVRWEDAAAYCAWLSETSGRAFRLPTEAEWEKAARGGLRGRRYPWGDRFDQSRANFLGDPAERHRRGTSPCRLYPPNDYGVFDAVGNVWEWVHDWYAPDAYATPARTNPQGPPDGPLRVVRGGAWVVADVRMLSCSHRHKVPPDTYSYAIGFRVASSV